MVQGWPQHMCFCSCRSSITEVCLWRIKVLSLWGFTVSVEGLCLCPTLCCLSANCCNKLNNCILVTGCHITVFPSLKRTQFFTGTKLRDIIHNYLQNVSLGWQTVRNELQKPFSVTILMYVFFYTWRVYKKKKKEWCKKPKKPNLWSWTVLCSLGIMDLWP